MQPEKNKQPLILIHVTPIQHISEKMIYNAKQIIYNDIGTLINLNQL